MPVTMRIPDALRPVTGGREEVAAEGNTIVELLEDLETRFNGVRNWACDDEGKLRPYVKVFINREDAHTKGGLSAAVSAGDVVSIVAAVTGGAASSRKLYLTFPQELIKQPLIFRVGHEFNIVTNIKAASVSESIGLVAVEFEGEPDELERAVEWLKNQGVKIEPLEDEE